MNHYLYIPNTREILLNLVQKPFQIGRQTTISEQSEHISKIKRTMKCNPLDIIIQNQPRADQ
jgi:hypothetical protein